MPKAFVVMPLMPKVKGPQYKAPPPHIQPSAMGPKWLDCKNSCLKYMWVFLGLLLCCWYLPRYGGSSGCPVKAPPETTSLIYVGKCHVLSQLTSRITIDFWGEASANICWDQDIVHLLAAEASSPGDGITEVVGPKDGLLGLLSLLSVAVFLHTSCASGCLWKTRPLVSLVQLKWD